MAKCAVCDKPATKFDGWMVGNNGVKKYSGPTTFGWCDEHYKDRHKYKMIFESEAALELWKSRVPHLYKQLSMDEILIVYPKEVEEVAIEPEPELVYYKGEKVAVEPEETVTTESIEISVEETSEEETVGETVEGDVLSTQEEDG